mmetsp:Transcript_41278/g.95264  ORF Transcript_41278/g.95264 Transcript_41278/m.95264 type:complete len:274 (+) Transcript_41278:321-1142(+)
MRHYAPAKDKGEFDTAWCLAPVGATCVCWGTCLEYTWCDCRYCCKTCCLSWGCKEGCAICCASGCSKCCACHCCASWCGCLTSATCTLPILAYSCGGVALGIACVACCLGYRRLQQKSVERPPPRSASSHVENALQNPIPHVAVPTTGPVKLVSITVPMNCRAGDMIDVVARDGTRLRLLIPQGALPGHVLRTSYSAPEPGYSEPVIAVPVAEPVAGAVGGGYEGGAAQSAVPVGGAALTGDDGFPAYDPAEFDDATFKQPSAPSAPPGPAYY